MELNLVGNLLDKYKKSSSFLFELKIADETIAKWTEVKSSNGKFMKKIRFPFKFKYISSNVRLCSFKIIRSA